MKIALLSQALTHRYGGSAVSEATLCAYLQSRCDLTVLCLRGTVETAFVRKYGISTVKEFDFFMVVGALLGFSNNLTRWLEDVDVVHLNGHWRWDTIAITRYCARKGIPFLLQPRGMLWLGHRKIWLKRVFNQVLGSWAVKQASCIVALSRFEVRQWQPYASILKHIEIIPNAIMSLPAEEQSSEKTSPYFLYLGRLESRKNLPFLVDAYAEYVRTGGASELWLVGPVERNYDRVLKKQIEAKKLGARVRLLPPSYGAEKTRVMRDAQAVVYPSVGEAFGRVPFETIAAGGVSLVPSESGSAEYLEEFLPECIFRLDDKYSLISQFHRLDSGGRSEWQGGLDQARKWIETELTWETQGQRLMALYDGIEKRDESTLPQMPSLGGLGEQPPSPVLQ